MGAVYVLFCLWYRALYVISSLACDEHVGWPVIFNQSKTLLTYLLHLGPMRCLVLSQLQYLEALSAVPWTAVMHIHQKDSRSIAEVHWDSVSCNCPSALNNQIVVSQKQLPH